MLSEFLLQESSGQIRWSKHMPGVQVCQFELADPLGEQMRSIPVVGKPLYFETLFCQKGRVITELKYGNSSMTEREGVWMLSDSSCVRSFQISGDLKGILISVDGGAARESFFSVCSLIGMVPDTKRVKQRMDARHGCWVLSHTPWVQAMFGCLEFLSEDAQRQYCVFKAVELLYLLCTENLETEQEIQYLPEGYVHNGILQAKQFMQENLSEKHTISALSKRFSVSPTFLKEGFRRAYGKPIHTWLVAQRMRRAQELLRSTQLPIQTIAQAVGYEGMSQFHAAFKRYCGTSPGQFRKMSKTVILHPF